MTNYVFFALYHAVNIFVGLCYRLFGSRTGYKLYFVYRLDGLNTWVAYDGKLPGSGRKVQLVERVGDFDFKINEEEKKAE